MFTYPIPCIPFPFEGEGEDKERGASAPLRHPRYGFGEGSNKGMSKYDSLKYWAEVKARTQHHCEKCDGLIAPGEVYYSEKLDGFVHAPHVRLRKLCQGCYKKSEQES